jgi:hypothetical protein
MQVDSSFSSKFKNDCSDKLGIIFLTSGIIEAERLAGKFLSVSRPLCKVLFKISSVGSAYSRSGLVSLKSLSSIF